MDYQLRAEVMAVIKQYKQEIYEQKDWWYGLSKHSINVHNLADEEDSCQVFSINVYQVGANGMDDYSDWEDLTPLTPEELLAL
jgi:hypothetical protein